MLIGLWCVVSLCVGVVIGLWLAPRADDTECIQHILKNGGLSYRESQRVNGATSCVRRLNERIGSDGLQTLKRGERTMEKVEGLLLDINDLGVAVGEFVAKTHPEYADVKPRDVAFICLLDEDTGECMLSAQVRVPKKDDTSDE